MVKDWGKLITSIIICQAAGLLGTYFTISAIPTWYATLNKPSFSPPNFLFGPVWLILYTLMGISLYLIWSKRKVPSVFWVQLFLNALWTPVFFGLKNPFLGLLIILALVISILLTIKEFLKINKTSAFLLAPYLAWVSFATLLNYNIWILNK